MPARNSEALRAPTFANNKRDKERRVKEWQAGRQCKRGNARDEGTELSRGALSPAVQRLGRDHARVVNATRERGDVRVYADAGWRGDALAAGLGEGPRALAVTRQNPHTHNLELRGNATISSTQFQRVSMRKHTTTQPPELVRSRRSGGVNVVVYVATYRLSLIAAPPADAADGC